MWCPRCWIHLVSLMRHDRVRALSPHDDGADMMLRTFLAALLSFAPALGLAQAEEPIRYQVELILFENTDPAAARAEHWPETVPTPNYESATGLRPPGARAAEFRALKDSAKELTGAAKLLTASERYTVIAHLLWEQPGLPSDSARAVRVRAGKNYGIEFPELMQPRLEFDADGNLIEIPAPDRLDELEGTVRIVLGRYLHVYTDLLFRKPLSVTEYNESADMFVPVNRLQAIPVREWRRMRSRELHYIDHPLLGMLIKITPVAAPAKASGDTSPAPAIKEPESPL